MKLLDIVTSPWLILPEKLIEIQEIYITHLRGQKIDIGAIEASLGRPLNNEEKPYEIENGVAKIFIDGVISKRMNLFSRISGGVSSQLIARDFRAALQDEEVESILLYIDSPGGDVDGTQELAAEIYAARGQKPIVSFSDGTMASAAYYIGAAADKVFISGDNVQVGSIGVVARHMDVSKSDEMIGIKRTEIVAGKYKRIASELKPLTESGYKYLQDAVDHLYGVFVGDVAKFRGLSPEPVKDGKEEIIPWAEGKIFFGKKAIAAGLVDGVFTMDRLIGTYGTDQTRAVRMTVEDQVRKTLQIN